MAQIFWVQCPQCAGRFYCHTEDLWDAPYDLLCPFCAHTFSREAGVAELGSAKDPRVRAG